MVKGLLTHEVPCGNTHMHTQGRRSQPSEGEQGFKSAGIKVGEGQRGKMFAEKLLFYSRMAFHPLGFTSRVLDHHMDNLGRLDCDLSFCFSLQEKKIRNTCSKKGRTGFSLKGMCRDGKHRHYQAWPLQTSF